MDTTTHHAIGDLFTQLGLPDDPREIRAFVARHRPLPSELTLVEAPFWNDSQARFLKEQLRADDGDWAIVIDQLDALLREHPQVEELPQADADEATSTAPR